MKVFKNKKELCYNFAAKLRNKFQNINIEIYKKEKNDK